MKTCGRCGIEKETTDYSRDVHRPDGLRFYCKQCQADMRKIPKNKSKQAISSARFKIREQGLSVVDTLTPYEVTMTLGAGYCSYCMKELPFAEATIDHLKPLKRNGANTFANITASCKACNTAKSDIPAILFMLQSCPPYANRKLLEQIAHRSNRTTEEVFEDLAQDVQAYFVQRAEVNA